MTASTIPSIEEEFNAIKARVRKGGRKCSVAIFLGLATESEIAAYERAVDAGMFVAVAEHFRAKYPTTAIHQKSVRDHAAGRCGCFKS